MRYVGSSIPRPDGYAKVTGAAIYADDFTLPGLYHGMTVRSPHPCARIDAIRWNEETAPPDAVCVLAPDIRGRNGVQLLDDEWPVLARRFVNHVGEPVALVSGRTRQEAREAAKAVEVTYTPLEPVLTMEEGERRPLIHEIAFGASESELAEAFASAHSVIESESRTGLQEHIYIECQGITAWFDIDGMLHVVGTMQCPFYVLKAIVHCLGIPKESVRVKPSDVGGGFGGKEDFPSQIAIHAALLSRACGQPVRIVYDRQEDVSATTKRHPSRVRHRSAFAKDGRLLAMDVDVTLDGGAYRTLSPVVLSRAVLHATGPYRVPCARVQGRVVRTNTPPNGAFRGFGAPQVQFAVERQMDRAARELGLDPFEIRRMNALRPGDRLPTGQILDATTSAMECLEEVERLTSFRKGRIEIAAQATANGGPRCGLGISLFFHGAGFTGDRERLMHSPVTARLAPDGRIEILTANVDMGQGMAAVFPQIAADSAGVALEDVVVPVLDTSEVPDSGPTVASRTTMIVGALVARAAARLKESVLALWTGEHATPFRAIAKAIRAEHGDLAVTLHHEVPASQSFDEETYQGEAYPTYSWGADVAEVNVDPATLAVRPVRVTSVCEVGRAMHRALCIGQIEGGTLQAVGHALWEEIKVEAGRPLNDRLATYIIPTFPDSPRIDVHLLERPWEGGPFGAKGIGELPIDGGAAAIVQAIEHATGIVATEIPATPEKLLAWMETR
jgi:CO/xanthine dehydrogenase Mo-binding subunit